MERGEGEEEGVDVGTGEGSAGAEMVGGEAVAAALALAREALIAANPDAMPELIVGATAEELRASLAAAKAAFGRAVEAARAQLAGQVVSPGAPARTVPVNVEAMSASAKIAWALNRGQVSGVRGQQGTVRASG
jgi:hypothetical protein